MITAIRASLQENANTMLQPSSTEQAIEKFARHINTPQCPISNASSHTLHLTAVVLVPGPSLPASQIASLSPSAWFDTLNTRLLAPFTTLQAFLPLLTAQKSTLLFLTPSIVPSLAPPSHAAESVVAGGLQQYISTLRKEVQGQGVNIVQFQLGHFDYGLAASDDQQQLVLSQHMSVAEATKKRLQQKGLLQEKSKGTSLRELHNSVFDAIVRGKGKNGTVFVGQGARVYDLVGKLVPGGIVGWMMSNSKTKEAAPKMAVREGSPSGSAEWDKVSDRDSDGAEYVYPKTR